MKGSKSAEHAESLIKSVLQRLDMAEVMEEDLHDNIDHGELVAILARLLCTQMELPVDFQQQVVVAAYLHDIGKLRLSKNLYGRDKNALQIEETRYMRMHAKVGADMLRDCGFPAEICNAVHHHHENFDGSGYPGNLAEEKIPLEARILRICDVFGALISDRPYRKGFDVETAMDLLIEDNKAFDMKIFLDFMKIYHSEEFEQVIQCSHDINARKRYVEEHRKRNIS
ncbi:MAG: HD domain-containing protein [Lachnospiraceae bacterium]|nr:HD domain-containing protein [Lachnospiraceae bacterium]